MRRYAVGIWAAGAPVVVGAPACAGERTHLPVGGRLCLSPPRWPRSRLLGSQFRLAELLARPFQGCREPAMPQLGDHQFICLIIASLSEARALASR